MDFYPPTTLLKDIPPFIPKSGPGKEIAVFINGIGTTPEMDKVEAQLFADQTGYNVVGLYNATQGPIKDVLQTFTDTADHRDNKAVNSLYEVILLQLRNSEPVHLFAHSQGALITVRALNLAVKTLTEQDRLDSREVERRLANVEVETFAGPAYRYPDGPKYVHYINRWDPVNLYRGFWQLIKNKRAKLEPGEDGVVIRFNHFGWNVFAHETSPHLPPVYLQHRIPWDQAYKGAIR
jgi:hypothetical protein